ncbi:glycosyltransferase family 2 protein [Serratia fonticola]|uniref:glycosyltransferase family 2 protein n=1 Tax=Serratia fonticola TaxID=47917 RepID=UPI003BB4B504
MMGENSKKTPLVSIIMPTYNSSVFVHEAIQSILNQDYHHWELIITDDCSTDNTVSIIDTYSRKDKRIQYYINKSNSGAAITRNNSIVKARGDYVAFLDSDDLWHKDKLSSQIGFMLNSNSCFSFTPFSLVSEQGHHLNKTVDLNNCKKVNYHEMLAKKCTLGCSTVMLNRSSFPDLTMPLLRTGQDYALWLKLLKSGVQADCLNVPLTSYRIVKNSISRNKIKKAKRQWQIYREIESIGFLRSCYYFCFYAVRAVFRR